VHIPKFRNGGGKILANASTPDFSAASDIILGYALSFLRTAFCGPVLKRMTKFFMGWKSLQALVEAFARLA
jgi:hypothetical protein